MNCCQTQQMIEETPITEPLHNRAAVEHLHACRTCRSFREEQIKLQGLLDDLGRVEAPAWFDVRLNERLRRQAAKPWWSSKLLFTPNLPSIAITAWCVLAIALAVSLQRLTINPARHEQPITAGDKPLVIDTQARNRQADETEQSRVKLAGESDRPSQITATAGTSLTAKPDNSRTRHISRWQGEQSSSRLTRVAAASRRSLREIKGAARVATAPAITASAVKTSRSPVESILLGARSAPTVPISLPNSASVSATNRVVIDVPVEASGRTLHIAMPDAQGRTQTLSVEPLTFGANQLRSRASKINEAEFSNKKNRATKAIVDESDEVVW